MRKSEFFRIGLCYDIKKMNNPSNFIYSNISNNSKNNIGIIFNKMIDDSYSKYRDLLVRLYYETLKIN